MDDKWTSREIAPADQEDTARRKGAVMIRECWRSYLCFINGLHYTVSSKQAFDLQQSLTRIIGPLRNGYISWGHPAARRLKRARSTGSFLFGSKAKIISGSR